MYEKIWDFSDDPLKIISTLRIPNTAAQLLVPQDFMRALKLKKGDLVEFHISEIHRIKSDNPKEKEDVEERIVK